MFYLLIKVNNLIILEKEKKTAQRRQKCNNCFLTVVSTSVNT